MSEGVLKDEDIVLPGQRGRPGQGPDVSRRDVLGFLAGAGVLVAAKYAVGDLLAEPADAAYAAQVAADGELLVARAEDGLLLRISFHNLDVRTGLLGSNPRLVLHDAAQPGYIVLGLGPQSLFEQGVYDTAPPPEQPVQAVLAGPSRIALRLEPGSAPVAYSLENLLNLPAFKLSTSSIADNGSGTALPAGPPGPTETAIEAPWRLLLSPAGSATFTAARTPVTRNGRTELWHARAAGRLGDGTADQRAIPVPVRAIWTPDINGTDGSPAWTQEDTRVAITAAQRVKLVRATTTKDVNGDPAPADAALLLVSAMGASLSIEGKWADREDVTAWRHRSYLGRDNYVRIEEPGYLFPLGFRATKVSLTERVFGGGLAYLRKQVFYVVREPTVTYPGPAQPKGGRKLPFTKVATTTRTTPVVKQPAATLGVAERIQFDGTNVDIRFQLEFTGQDGKTAAADLPLLFVPADQAYAHSVMATLAGLYATEDEATRRTLRFDGQKLCYVPLTGPGGEDPALPTYDLVVTAEPGDGSVTEAAFQAQKRLNAYAAMVTAGVHLEVLDTVGGKHTEAAGTTAIALHSAYVDNAFGTANRAEVWASLPKPPDLSVPQETAGGLAAPGLAVQGLSRALGPVAEPDKVVGGEFDPKTFFPPGLKLLGGLDLQDVILKAVGLGDLRGPDGDNLPKTVITRTDSTIDTTVTWRPKLQPAGEGLFEPSADAANRVLDLKAVFHTERSTAATTSIVTGEMRDFTLYFVGQGPLKFIRQPVRKLRFESRNGGKPNLDVQLGTPEFTGDLAFLADLQQYLPAMPGGVKIDIQPSGVKAGLSIAIPTVGVGVVLVTNLSINMTLDLPFDGRQAVLGFSFATREHPFMVTVSALGGGGFLGIALGTRGVQMIEGSLEFGAAVAIDLGVASGSVSITAGIYFKYAQKLDATGQPAIPAGDTLLVTGFVRAVGTLDVLGLIHASLEFYLGLSYFKDKSLPAKKGVVQGDARLTVRVEVLFFSASVSVSMHKEFAAGADPGFGQLISSNDWSRYCAAFA